MAVYLLVMHTTGCSGCIRITEYNLHQVNYLCIVALGICDKWFSLHGDGMAGMKLKEGNVNVEGMFK